MLVSVHGAPHREIGIPPRRWGQGATCSPSIPDWGRPLLQAWWAARTWAFAPTGFWQPAPLRVKWRRVPDLISKRLGGESWPAPSAPLIPAFVFQFFPALRRRGSIRSTPSGT